ncbi:MAG: EAL domain-containing protein [Armatimonadetes bacterium]|nr:EAL domain-containing protein [Armatimonadota bacterium]
MELSNSRPPDSLTAYVLDNVRCLIWHAYVFISSEEKNNSWKIKILNEAAAQCWLPIKRHPENSFLQDLYLACSPLAQAQGEVMFTEAFQHKKKRCGRQFPMTLADGSEIWIHEDVHLEEVQPDHWHIVGVLTDVTTHKLSEERLLYLAHHDSLTQLPNRGYLFEVLAKAPSQSMRYLLYLDLDNFKVINDTLGHPIGDLVLFHLSNRLRSVVGMSGDVVRLGGDEFTVLLRPDASKTEAQELAESLLQQIRQPLIVEGQTLYLSTSIGIAATTDLDAPSLLRNADIAMYAAKYQGKNRIVAFDSEMERAVRSRFELEGELRKAIDKDGIGLVYQPILRLDSRKLIGLEGLARWSHPTLGMIPPDQFIPIAEETGLIIPLGLRLLKQACQQAVHWRRQHPDLVVGLNVSVVQLMEETFAQDVIRILEETGLPSEKLTLEVTESILAEGCDPVLRQLWLLYEAGVSLVLDDFGTGYSSFSALSELPLHALKIDRTFLARAIDPSRARAERNKALIRAITSAAQVLDLIVIAEGIEAEQQASLAESLGCQLGQGYHLQRPLTPQALNNYLGQVASASVQDFRESLVFLRAA